MNQTAQIQLKTSSILNVPLKYYTEDFLFIVNGKEFQTTRLIADLLSEKICHLHSIDPTIGKYSINTEEEGDFTHILDLVNFTANSVSENEIPFLIEVVDKLENKSIEIKGYEKFIKFTIDNVINKIEKHEKNSELYTKSFQNEIEFISSHFDEIGEQERTKIKNLKPSTLYEIFSHDKLKLKDEDQLFQMINELYSKDSQYSILYETVNFLNVSAESICNFVSQFDMNDLTYGSWHQICELLKKTVTSNTNNENDKKIEDGITFQFSEGQHFNGIINHLKQQSNNQLDKEISFSSSTNFSSKEKYKLQNIASFDNPYAGFATNNLPNSWICIDFREHRVIPTDYTIKSIGDFFTTCQYLKSWVIETSNDNITWNAIDEVKCSSALRGNLVTHTFKIQKQQSKMVRYVRLRMTDTNWYGDFYLSFDSFEIFGTLI